MRITIRRRHFSFSHSKREREREREGEDRFGDEIISLALTGMVNVHTANRKKGSRIPESRGPGIRDIGVVNTSGTTFVH